MRKRKRGKNRNGTILLTLCARCAQQFYDSGEHIIRRADPKETIMETCSYCDQRRGWSYTIQNRRKSSGTNKENKTPPDRLP